MIAEQLENYQKYFHKEKENIDKFIKAAAATVKTQIIITTNIQKIKIKSKKEIKSSMTMKMKKMIT